MTQTVSRTLKDTVVYGLGNFSVKAIGFILIQFYITKLSLAEFGVLSLFEVTTQVLLTILTLGLNYAIERWFWYESTLHKRKKILFSVLLVLLLIQCVFLITGISFRSVFSYQLTSINGLELIWVLLMVNTSLEVISTFFLSIIKLNQKPLLYISANILRLIVTLGLTILFIAYYKMGISGIYKAQLIGFIPLFILTTPFIIKQLEWGFEKDIIKEMLRFSTPYILAGMSVLMTSFADVYMLKILVSIEEAGIYTLGLKIANFVKVFLVSSIQLAVVPNMYRMEMQPNARNYYSSVLTNYGMLILVTAIGISLYSNEIIYLIAKKEAFYPAAWVVLPILIAILFNFMKDIVGIGVSLQKESLFISIANLLSGLLNIAFNYIFIKQWGFIGVAISSIICQALLFITIYLRSQKVYPVPYKLLPIFGALALGIALALLSHALPNSLLTLLIIKPILFLILVVAIIIWFPSIRQQLTQVINKVTPFRSNP